MCADTERGRVYGGSSIHMSLLQRGLKLRRIKSGDGEAREVVGIEGQDCIQPVRLVPLRQDGRHALLRL